MNRLPDNELRRVLHYAVYPNMALNHEGKRLYDSINCKDWRQQVLKHIRNAIQLDPFYGVFVYGTERAFGLSFMKRTPKPLFKEMHSAYLRAVVAGEMPQPMQHTFDELKAQVDGYASID
jgi:hypothetical protein